MDRHSLNRNDDAAAELRRLRDDVLDAQIHLRDVEADLDQPWEAVLDAEANLRIARARLSNYLDARGWRLVA
jgi:hypothetical protein